MDKRVQEDIISVLNQALALIQKHDFSELKELSNHTIHNASIFQDQDSIQIAVIVYSLAKIIERAEQQGQTISMNVTKTMGNALTYLRDDDESKYHDEIKKVLKQLSESDQRIVMYVQQVIEKAHIVKGGNLYRHGISMGRAAEILGVNQWDLMSFVGKTRIADEDGILGKVNDRLSFSKKLFKVP